LRFARDRKHFTSRGPDLVEHPGIDIAP
jgi:hypothetical protein